MGAAVPSKKKKKIPKGEEYFLLPWPNASDVILHKKLRTEREIINLYLRG